MFEKIALYAALVTTFLVPIIAIPSVSIPFDATKMFCLALGTLVALVSLCIAHLKTRSFSVVRDVSLYVAALVPVSLIISAFAGVATNRSFMGIGVEAGTVSTVALLIILGYVVLSVLHQKSRVLYFYTAFVLGAVLVAFYQVVRMIFGADVFAFGLAQNPLSNFVGAWNDLGIYFGIVTILSMLTLSGVSLGKKYKALFYVSLVVSLLLLVYINFVTVWYVLGLFSLLFALHTWNTARTHMGMGKAIAKAFLPIAVLIISIIGITGTEVIGGVVSKNFNVNNIDVRPSWQLTFDIAYQTLRERPFFGAGPNTFAHQYLAFKPQSINSTVFWNTEFQSAIGYLPTLVITGGLVMLLLVLLFVIFFVQKAIRTVRHLPTESFSRYTLLSSLFVTAYLWVVLVIYTPSLGLLTLTSVFTAIFFGAYFAEYPTKKTVLLWTDKGVRMILVSIILGIVMLAVLAWLYTLFGRYVAALKFQDAVVSLSRNSASALLPAEEALISAAKWAPSDSYYQALSEVNLIKLNYLASTATSSTPQTIAALQSFVSSAIAASQKAIEYDPRNYRNYISLAKAYESVVPMEVKDAYENAQKSYVAAANLNQLNPSVYLSLANLEVARKNYPEAKKYIGAALQVKNNFSDAIFLLSQIQVAEGSVKDAITSSQALVQLNPGDATVYFQLGLLYYNDKNYQSAIEAFEKAVSITPQYSNARYFLGLSYARINKNDEALAQFVEIEKYNPGNQEVELILKNLQAGKSPFTNAKPPVDTKPEKRKTLPVKDRLDKSTTTQVDSR